MMKRWIVRDNDSALAFNLSRKLHISPLTAQLLVNRGIHDVARAQSFLNPMLKDLYDPFLLNDMDRAVDRILSAITKREKIVIHGDYDIDGVTAVVLLYNFLKRMGAEVDYVLPVRSDGYGLKPVSIKLCVEKGARLIITVDCGIGSAKEIAGLSEQGIDVIVTDHHEPEGDLPKCCAVVNAKRADSTYPFSEIAGVGVAFKLAHGVLKKCKNGNLSEFNSDIDLRDYLDLVCMGTIGDVLPLIDENRIITKFGLQKIATTTRAGVKALKTAAGLEGDIDAEHISFRLAPRINATGRVSLAHKAAMLLLCEEELEAEALAMELENHNKDRQKIEAEVLKEAFLQVEKDINLDNQKIIIVWGDNWHHGVIGIVASRLVRKYNRPAVVISVDDEMCKGSARSIDGFNILDALRSCSDKICNLGGHEGAAGMSILKENLDVFRTRVCDFVGGKISESDMVPKISIDMEIKLEDIAYSGLKEIEKLEPFGYGNERPVFLSRNVRLTRAPRIVGQSHLKLFVDCSGMEIDVIGFGLAEEAEKLALKSSDRIDIVYTPGLNTFRGEEKLQLELQDFTRALVPSESVAGTFDSP